MEEDREIRSYLIETMGEECCEGSCDMADIFRDEEGWKLNMCGFMAPWKLGKTVEEVKARIREYAPMSSLEREGR